MSQPTQRSTVRRHWLQAALAGTAGVAALLAGCSTPPPAAAPAPVAPPKAAAPAPAPTPAPAAAVPAGKISNATTPLQYRHDAAAHLYALNGNRIYKGRMPPLLYAVGVLQVQVDANGQVQSVNWLRAPKHAPEVMAEIERTVRKAAPFPVAARLGPVTYTDTWLWHKSGRFQLDTLTEGQD